MDAVLRIYTEGRNYGYLACILRQIAYRLVINEAAWAYKAPQDQGAYDPNAVANVTGGQRSQMEGVHIWKNENYQLYLGIEEGSKELIVYDVGEESLPP